MIEIGVKICHNCGEANVSIKGPDMGLSNWKFSLFSFPKFMTMAGNKTFTMIKPEAVAAEQIGAILDRITQGGFKIVAMKMTQLSLAQAQEFYGIHSERPFFEELTNYMAEGPIVAAILEKENAVLDYRSLIGTTDPEQAEEGTIRKEFAQSKAKNAVHGSDSDDNAAIESTFFFTPEQVFQY